MDAHILGGRGKEKNAQPRGVLWERRGVYVCLCVFSFFYFFSCFLFVKMGSWVSALG